MSGEAGAITLRRACAADAETLAAIQNGAYARNRVLLGVEPLPLLTSARQVIADKETWLLEDDGEAVAALALESEGEVFLIWSVATRPDAEGRGHGGRLLDFAERRARETGASRIALYTGEKLTRNVEWYRRRGFGLDRVEERSGRRIVHMSKPV